MWLASITSIASSDKIVLVLERWMIELIHVMQRLNSIIRNESETDDQIIDAVGSTVYRIDLKSCCI